jgi:hypothetical protein
MSPDGVMRITRARFANGEKLSRNANERPTLSPVDRSL